MANKKEQRKSNIPNKNANESNDKEYVFKEGNTVSDLAEALGRPLAEIVKKLFLQTVVLIFCMQAMSVV